MIDNFSFSFQNAMSKFLCIQIVHSPLKINVSSLRFVTEPFFLNAGSVDWLLSKDDGNCVASLSTKQFIDARSNDFFLRARDQKTFDSVMKFETICSITTQRVSIFNLAHFRMKSVLVCTRQNALLVKQLTKYSTRANNKNIWSRAKFIVFSTHIFCANASISCISSLAEALGW